MSRQCVICSADISHRHRKAEVCGRACQIKRDGLKRRESGRLRKANMSPEKYARLQAQKKADRARARQDGRAYQKWDCVTCGETFRVKKYSEAGYWCSNHCRAEWQRLPKEKQTIYYANTCITCRAPFLTPYQPHKTCSPRCKNIHRPGSKWISPQARQDIYHRDRWTCHICNKAVPQDLQYDPTQYEPLYPSLDHVIPRAHGGTDHPSNLRLAHTICNSTRRDNPLVVPPGV